MDIETARRLNTINTAFYEQHHASFSATRSGAWRGWEQCLPWIDTAWPINDSSHSRGNSTLTVLDLACGNMRFDTFLHSSFPHRPHMIYGVDQCTDMVPTDTSEHVQNLDIIQILLSGDPLVDHLRTPPCDVSVSFGFLHHIPMADNRAETIRSLVTKTRPGGIAIVTAWQFLASDKLKRQAEATTRQGLKDLGLGPLDDGDYLLGWQNMPGAYRYCHHFSEADIDQLVASVSESATLHARFVADGRDNNLNTYLVFQVH